MMKKLAAGATVIIIALITIGALAYTYWPYKIECVTDSDCIPNACCHPESCVSKENAPECKTIFCSMECKENTTDCGQGKCICDNGKCDVEWKNE